MKKILLSVLALLALAGIGTAQTLPSYVPANGLVGWWPFNGNANDESGNNNNGTVNGATLTSDRFGNVGKAYGFDGNGDYIGASSNNLPAAERTISVWFNANNIIGGPTILGYGGNTCGNSFFIAVNEPSIPNVIINQGHCIVDSLTTPFLANYINEWHHLVITTSSSGTKHFVDGQKTAENSVFISNTFVSNRDFAIGSTVGNNGFMPWTDDNLTYWKGSLDDIAIYNRALTQQEITGLYQGANTTANCLDLPSNLQQGLVGYWPFCGNALDESGNGNHGTVNGAMLTADRFGNAGSAYGFDGVNDNITIQNSLLPNTASDYTISTWANAETFSGGSVVLTDRFGGSYAYKYGLGILPDSSYYANIYDSVIENIAKSMFKAKSNVWVNMTSSYNSLSNSIKLFINGLLIDSVIRTAAWNNVSNPTVIGQYVGPISSNYFHGQLDDIAIWNRALTPQEIKQVYNQGICQTSITVTDTLLIHTGITAYNPVAYGNTLKVWPNPGNTAITLDAGNLSSMQGWKYKVANTLGQTVVNETAINQQQTNISLSTWGGNGIYYLHLINPQGHAIEIKKIVLAP